MSASGSTVDVSGSESVRVGSGGAAVELGGRLEARVSASSSLELVSGESMAVSSESVAVFAGGVLDATAGESIRVMSESISVDSLRSIAGQHCVCIFGG